MSKREEKMTDEENRIEPLCKFGPGGDFVTSWEVESVDPGQQAEDK